MNDKSVVFLDSGVGGLPYCAYFVERNPQIKALYIADREHFPYGAKSKEEIVRLLSQRIAAASERFNPAVVVLACNTASVSALCELRKQFAREVFVGTVPAVKPAVLASKAGHIGVLGTERTIEDSYIGKLVAGAGRRCRMSAIAAPELVDFVENSLLHTGAAQKTAAAKAYVDRFRALGVDAIVLGCTHFLFLLDEFKEAADDDIAIYDSVAGVCRRVESLLQETKAEQAQKTHENMLLVTGDSRIEDKWKEMAALFHLKAALFGDFAA
ncbi:MAG: glutamate racemase [Spirochaetaceae bacterium]|jgi:glutamate racemase|nr:glutamate racemase [Spirochaetaceae bacterium]